MNNTNYIAFLRGINISGKNKIAMAELKTEFEQLNFTNVSTYLNSGNVLFSSSWSSIKKIKSAIEKMIAEKFALEIPVHVIESKTLSDILAHAPAWWSTGDKDKYDNLIFILAGDSPADISNLIGAPSENLETTQIYGDVIFWTFDRAKYRKCNWWKRTASAGITEKLTIRTANTLKKLCAN